MTVALFPFCQGRGLLFVSPPAYRTSASKGDSRRTVTGPDGNTDSILSGRVHILEPSSHMNVK